MIGYFPSEDPSRTAYRGENLDNSKSFIDYGVDDSHTSRINWDLDNTFESNASLIRDWLAPHPNEMEFYPHEKEQKLHLLDTLQRGLGGSRANEYGNPLVGSWDEGGWFFGIPNMTRDDYQGGVYWKGIPVEHYDHDYFGYNDDNDDWVNKMREDAKKLERKILELEAKNIPVNMTTVLG